jgi:SulP family sulfate permease
MEILLPGCAAAQVQARIVSDRSSAGHLSGRGRWLVRYDPGKGLRPEVGTDLVIERMRTGAASAVGGWYRGIRPNRATIGQDAVAAIPRAIGSVPDGMAAAVLAGVSPIHGLYASFAGPIAGGLFTSTGLMVVTTTSAGALAAGSALSGLSGDQRLGPLFLLTLMAGAVMVLAGIARLGRYTRFVSHSVMIGFLSGVAVNIAASQLPDLTGSEATGGVAVTKALNVIFNPSGVDVASLLVGLSAIGLIVLLGRTRIAAFSAVVALIIPTLVVALLDLTSVATVSDVGQIERGAPLPGLPNLADFSLNLLSGALAVAAIVLVQGAGVAESAPNLDGSRSNANRDFVAQGAGNIAAGFFAGLPVGGSVGQTALNRSSGARTRWAAIISGLFMLLVLIALGGLVGHVAMPTLAAVLIVAAIGSLRLGQALTVWRTGLVSQIAMATTFLSTLFLPVAAAVGIGTALSLLLQLNRDALDLRVVEMRRRDDGRWEERRVPLALPDRSVTVLEVYGSLFYAGAKTLEARLPNPSGSQRPAVVLRLRGRTTIGATALTVLAGYAEKLRQSGGRLYLSGVAPGVASTFARTQRMTADGPLQIQAADTIIGASTDAAYEAAVAWVAEDGSTEEA